MPPETEISRIALAFPYMDWTCILLAVRELGKTSVSADFAERMGNLHGAISQALLAAVRTVDMPLSIEEGFPLIRALNNLLCRDKLAMERALRRIAELEAERDDLGTKVELARNALEQLGDWVEAAHVHFPGMLWKAAAMQQCALAADVLAMLKTPPPATNLDAQPADSKADVR